MATSGYTYMLKAIREKFRVKTSETSSDELRGFGTFHLSSLLLRFLGHIFTTVVVHSIMQNAKKVFKYAKFRNSGR